MGFLNPLGMIHKVIGGGLITVVIALALWGWRVNDLRDRYMMRLDDTAAILSNALDYSKPITRRQIVSGVTRLKEDRDHYKSENAAAGRQLTAQNAQILDLGKETEYLRMVSEMNRDKAREVIRERNVAIERFRSAQTRTEQLEAQVELDRCEEALDALYENGF